MIKMLLLLELLPFCFLFFLHSPAPIVAEQPPGQSPELQHLDAVAPVQAAPPAPSLPGPADGNGNSSSASSQAAASRFVPLLRQGHLVEAKFNQPTGPLQARLSFGQREKNGGKGGEEQEQARRQGQPAVGGQQGRGPFSTRAIFSGRDPSSGAFFRKRFNATLSDDGKKRSGIRDGDQNAGKAIRDGDQDILELGSGRSSDEGRQRAELKERPPADRLVVEPRKVGEEKPKAEENAKKDEAKKEESKVNGITLESGAVKEVKEEKKPVEEPKKAEEEQQKRAEDDNSADQARRSEEWNGWGFLPSFFQWEGARKSEAANDQSQPQQQQQPNANNQSSSQLQVRPSGGAVQLQPAAGDQGGRAASAPAKCQDQAENCVDNRAFCRVSPYEELMAENCAKTCELCVAGEEGAKGGGNETANGEEEKAREREAKKEEEEKAKQQPEAADAEKPAEQSKPVEDESNGSNCRDLSSRCSQWAQRGFCASRFFHRDLKARFCAKSCALCGNGEKKEGVGGEK